MAKSTVTRLFFGGIVAAIAGVVFGFLAVWAAYASGAFVMSGPDVTGITMTPFAWLMVGVAVASLFVVIGGFIAGLVAWIGALLNTAQLEDKAWFLVLLLLGIFSLGFAAMLVYVLAGPDGTAQRRMPAGSPA